MLSSFVLLSGRLRFGMHEAIVASRILRRRRGLDTAITAISAAWQSLVVSCKMRSRPAPRPRPRPWVSLAIDRQKNDLFAGRFPESAQAGGREARSVQPSPPRSLVSCHLSPRVYIVWCAVCFFSLPAQPILLRSLSSLHPLAMQGPSGGRLNMQCRL